MDCFKIAANVLMSFVALALIALALFINWTKATGMLCAHCEGGMAATIGRRMRR